MFRLYLSCRSLLQSLLVHPLELFYLFSIATGAIADTPSPWTLVEIKPNQDQLYLNVQTIQKKGAVVTFDVFNRFHNATPTGVAAIAITYEGNCRYNRLRQLEGASYDARLQVLATGNATASERKWQIVKQGMPSSQVEAIIESVSIAVMALYLIARNCIGANTPDWLAPVESFTYLLVLDSMTEEEAIAQARKAGIHVVGSEVRDRSSIVAKRIEGDRVG